MHIKAYESKKVADYLRQDKPGRVCLVFAHGVGDTILFIEPYKKLRSLFPDIQIDLVIPKSFGQEVLIPDAILVSDASLELDGYDFTFVINFPMSEHTNGLWTKAEWCCMQELGIEPVSDFPKFPDNIRSSLVGVSFQATALPNACNPSEEVAEKIWKEVIAAGFIPVETLFKHIYFNPANVQFACVNRDVRDMPASLDTLIRLMSSCYANITVATGTLPLSIALMHERTLFLKKDFSIKSYTKKPISEIDVNDYKNGSVKGWLKQMEKMY